MDQVVIVLAALAPKPDLWLLDRMLIMAQAMDMVPVICLNKQDLDPDEILRLTDIYTPAGFRILAASTRSGLGLDALKTVMKEKISVFAGPSGVGKSSLLNAIEPALKLKTGEISEKLGRGRHTTRHVELLPLSFGGWVADTPGFSRVYLPETLKSAGLIRFFPDLNAYADQCQFASCTHRQERFCGVREAVRAGWLDPGRYERYKALLDETAARERRY
jgi:ribosome biogenesis GTPase